MKYPSYLITPSCDEEDQIRRILKKTHRKVSFASNIQRIWSLWNESQLALIICCLIISLCSCEKDLPFPEQDVQSKMVVNAAFSTDSLWKVHVSKSIPVSQSGKPENLSNAELLLKDENNSIIATLEHQANGFYTTSSNPEGGKTYQLEVVAPGFESVTAQSYQPKNFEFNFIDTTRSTYLDFPVLFIDLEIEDNAEEENYYLIEVLQIIDRAGEDTLFTFNPYHYVFDQNTENDDINTENSGYERVYLPDLAFNGEKYTTRLAVEIGGISQEENANVALVISVSSASSDLYKYAKTLESYHLSNGELFAEPVEIYNNIEKGLGIFGGFISKQIVLNF